MFSKSSDTRSVELVDVEGRRNSRVHGHTPMHAYLGKGKYIGNRVGVVPDKSDIW